MEQAIPAGSSVAALVHDICGHVERVVRVIVVALAVAMLASLTLQVVMRYVFGKSPSWSEELALACFSWSMLLAIAAGVRGAIHVRMDLLVDHLPVRLQQVLDKLVSLAIAGTGAFIAWSGVHYVQDTAGATSAAIGYPITYLYLCAPVCGVLITVFALERALVGAATPTGQPAA